MENEKIEEFNLQIKQLNNTLTNFKLTDSAEWVRLETIEREAISLVFAFGGCNLNDFDEDALYSLEDQIVQLKESLNGEDIKKGKKDKVKHKYLVGYIGDKHCVYGNDDSSDRVCYAQPMTLHQAKQHLKRLNSDNKAMYELKRVEVE